ncbi:MAG: hypothetical protein U0835_27040 [Isosphaeraceae bacterium]
MSSTGAVPSGLLGEEEYFRLTRHEDDVINHRLTWLLAGQPLLFLAYGNIVTAKLGVGEKLVEPGAVSAAREWIPLTGGLMALAVWFGVLGAVIALFKLSRGRAAARHAGVSLFTTVLGLVPSLVIPWVFVLAWWRIGR